jgi:hypothetical protein
VARSQQLGAAKPTRADSAQRVSVPIDDCDRSRFFAAVAGRPVTVSPGKDQRTARESARYREQTGRCECRRIGARRRDRRFSRAYCFVVLLDR